MGDILGPICAGLMYRLGGTVLAFVSVAFIVILLFAFVIQFVSVGRAIHSYSSPDKGLLFAAISALFRPSKLRSAYCFNLLTFIAVQGFFRIVPLYCQKKWNIELSALTGFISFLSLICFVANAGLVKILSRYQRSGRFRLLFLCLSGCVSLILLPIHSWVLFQWVVGLGMIPTVLLLSLSTCHLSRLSSPTELTWSLSINQSLLVLSEALSVFVFSWFGAHHLGYSILCIGLLFFMVSLGLFCRTRRQGQCISEQVY